MVIDRGYKNNFFENSSEHAHERFWSCYSAITQLIGEGVGGVDEMFVMKVIYLDG